MTAAQPPVSPQPPPELHPVDRAAALELLRDPALPDRIVEDLTRLGVEGEDGDILLAYLALTSRRLARPISVVLEDVPGASAALAALLALLPEPSREYYAVVTKRALFCADDELQHKVLALSPGALKSAQAALLPLIRDGEAALASTARDPETKEHTLRAHHTVGPVALLLCANGAIDPELAEHCLALRLRAGDDAPTFASAARELESTEDDPELAARQAILRKHRALQRLLEMPFRVRNRFATEFVPPAHWGSAGRHYRAAIHALALLRQAHRELVLLPNYDHPVRPVEVRGEDVAAIDRLFGRRFHRPLPELPPRSRKLLCQLDEVVGELAAARGVPPFRVLFTRAELVGRLDVGHSQLHALLRRLTERGYVVEVGRRGRAIVYRLANRGPTGWSSERRPPTDPARAAAAADPGSAAPFACRIRPAATANPDLKALNPGLRAPDPSSDDLNPACGRSARTPVNPPAERELPASNDTQSGCSREKISREHAELSPEPRVPRPPAPEPEGAFPRAPHRGPPPTPPSAPAAPQFSGRETGETEAGRYPPARNGADRAATLQTPRAPRPQPAPAPDRLRIHNSPRAPRRP